MTQVPEDQFHRRTLHRWQYLLRLSPSAHVPGRAYQPYFEYAPAPPPPLPPGYSSDPPNKIEAQWRTVPQIYAPAPLLLWYVMRRTCLERWLSSVRCSILATRRLALLTRGCFHMISAGSLTTTCVMPSCPRRLSQRFNVRRYWVGDPLTFGQIEVSLKALSL